MWNDVASGVSMTEWNPDVKVRVNNWSGSEFALANAGYQVRSDHSFASRRLDVGIAFNCRILLVGGVA